MKKNNPGHGYAWLALCCAGMLFFYGCSGSKQAAPEAEPSDSPRPLVRVLIDNGGFEADTAWTRSAPPGYDRYAVMEFDSRRAATGKRSGYIRINRHPGADEAKILHAWSQKLPASAAGQTLRFGGWVLTEGEPEVHLVIEYEPEAPIAGRKVVSERIEVLPLPENRFRLFQKRIHLPPRARRIVFYAGISSRGAVWFDNLFVFIDTTQPE